MFCHKFYVRLQVQLFSIFLMDWTSNITNVHRSVLNGVVHLYYNNTTLSSSDERKFTEYCA